MGSVVSGDLNSAPTLNACLWLGVMLVYNPRILCRQIVTVFLSPGTIATSPRARNESWSKSKRDFHEIAFFGVFQL